MNSKTSISLTEARKKIFTLVDEVQKPNNYYVLTEKSKPKAVLISADEFDSILETMAVYNDFPGIEEEIDEAKGEIEKGKTYSLEQVRQELP